MIEQQANDIIRINDRQKITQQKQHSLEQQLYLSYATIVLDYSYIKLWTFEKEKKDKIEGDWKDEQQNTK